MLVIRLINLALLVLALIGLVVMVITFMRSQNVNKGQSKLKKGALPSDAGVRELVLKGQKQEAIILYQRFTGVDEFTARDAVDEIERELRLSDSQRDKFRDILESEGKASAIENFQAETGANLADALEFVESLEKRNA